MPPLQLTRLLRAYPAEVQAAAAELVGHEDPDGAVQLERLKELEGGLKKGDVARGESLFFGPKASCGACHQVAERGAECGAGSFRHRPNPFAA